METIKQLFLGILGIGLGVVILNILLELFNNV